MQLKPNDYFPGANGFCNLEPGRCGPVYVSRIWTEDQGATYGDWYFTNEIAIPRPRMMTWKVELECESPEILNSILGQIRNIVACPYDEEPKIENYHLTYVGKVDTEEDLPSIANFGDYYYDKNGFAYLWLGSWNTISPYIEDPVEILTRNIQETMVKTLSDEIAKCYIDSIRYKLKHKVLHKC